jgi:hypothetical protein
MQARKDRSLVDPVELLFVSPEALTLSQEITFVARLNSYRLDVFVIPVYDLSSEQPKVRFELLSLNSTHFGARPRA